MKTRIIGLLILVALWLGIMLPAFSEKRLDGQVKELLREVQTALQNYHVDEELYPKSKMSGAELIGLLDEGGYLEAPPLNPWTTEPYQTPDDPIDFLEYETDELAETYTLIARTKDSDEVHHILDSTAHHSLE
ncbi:hypothetical protein OAL00_04800 [Verrucomicrobiales bacterium]|nr:hypothetical protein [Verrucomicrobiales bacterium]MDC0314406.1 hypothetical protein [bacterium]